MNAFPRCRRSIQTLAFVASLVAGTLCFVNVNRAETFSDQGVTNYLHHKLGFHDFFYGPGGVVPRVTGLPEHAPTRNNVSLLHGTYQHRVIPNSRVARRPAPSRTIRLDDLNLLVTTPIGSWEKLDSPQTGSKAHLVLRRTNPTIFISLAGQRADSDTIHTNSSLLSESQAKMQSFPGAAIQPLERPFSANGIPGITYQATVPSGESTIYYALWVAAHNGYNYKLAVYGNQQDQPAIDEALQTFLHGLKPIQPNRIAHRSGNKKTTIR